MWDQPCHATVPWSEVDGILVQRARWGSLEVAFSEYALQWMGAATTSIAMRHVLERWKLRRAGGGNGDSGAGANRDAESELDDQVVPGDPAADGTGAGAAAGDPDEYDEAFRADLLEVLPFLPDADFFVGNRHDWDVEDPIGPVDADVVDDLFDFFTHLNMEITGSYPTEVTETSGAVRYDRNLVSLGGPIPNWYTRNLMYGSEVDVPYRFCLNPEPDRVDLSGYGPAELRALGRKDQSEFEGEPNWYLVDEDGEVATGEGESARPKFTETPDWKKPKRWYWDYFTVIKAPNVHPAAADHRLSLCLAGCHGLGGRAALEAVQDPELVEEIHDAVGDGCFQAVGRVHEHPPGERRISLPIVEPL